MEFSSSSAPVGWSFSPTVYTTTQEQIQSALVLRYDHGGHLPLVNASHQLGVMLQSFFRGHSLQVAGLTSWLSGGSTVQNGRPPSQGNKSPAESLKKGFFSSFWLILQSAFLAWFFKSFPGSQAVFLESLSQFSTC